MTANINGNALPKSALISQKSSRAVARSNRELGAPLREL
jgi:hypothetical protein